MYKTQRIDDNSYWMIIKLYKTINKNQSLKLIKNKFNTIYFNKKNIGMIALTEANEPAAYYGVFPIILSYQSQDYLVAQSGNTITSPKHQKKGLFVKLGLLTIELAKNEDIKLLYGFPNENSYHGFKSKLNWVFNDSMQKFIINGAIIPLTEIIHLIKFLKPLYRQYLKFRFVKFKIELTEPNISCFSLNKSIGYIKKDIIFFSYKLLNKDIYLLKINEFSLLIKIDIHLKIGDVGYFQEDRIENFISTIKKLSHKTLSNKIIFMMSKNSWLYSYLIKYFKSNDNCSIGFYEFSNDFNIHNIEFVYSDIDTF